MPDLPTRLGRRISSTARTSFRIFREVAGKCRGKLANRSDEKDFDMWEKNLSAYVMLDFGRQHRGHALVRQHGFALDLEVDRATTGNVQPVERMVFVDMMRLRIWEFELGPAEFQEHGNRLAELLPSLNLKFNITDDLVGRFAWGKVMTQPSFTQLNPGGREARWAAPVVEEGDPKLNPYIAEQLDIGLEWYPTDDAIFAIHAFGKEVDEFIVQMFRSSGTGSSPTAARCPTV